MKIINTIAALVFMTVFTGLFVIIDFDYSDVREYEEIANTFATER